MNAGNGDRQGTRRGIDRQALVIAAVFVAVGWAQSGSFQWFSIVFGLGLAAMLWLAVRMADAPPDERPDA